MTEIKEKISVRMYDSGSADPLTHERGVCLENDCHVRKYFLILKECTHRVTSKDYTLETCHQETVDMMQAIDHCVADKAFAKIS
ncbi:cytochrome b-c1 complex subunit 6, mitochondrial-like [Anticarsia gemmatalis]|uniref:cytochrome b-c1 complex subunit 6, mitochondrial-like n=1 Tax=Anticarsia gemmatalis TaxID=129554 RepID=UPI003F76B8F1